MTDSQFRALNPNDHGAAEKLAAALAQGLTLAQTQVPQTQFQAGAATDGNHAVRRTGLAGGQAQRRGVHTRKPNLPRGWPFASMGISRVVVTQGSADGQRALRRFLLRGLASWGASGIPVSEHRRERKSWNSFPSPPVMAVKRKKRLVDGVSRWRTPSRADCSSFANWTWMTGSGSATPIAVHLIEEVLEAAFRDFHIFRMKLDADELSAQALADHPDGAGAKEGIEHKISNL